MGTEEVSPGIFTDQLETINLAEVIGDTYVSDMVKENIESAVELWVSEYNESLSEGEKMSLDEALSDLDQDSVDTYSADMINKAFKDFQAQLSDDFFGVLTVAQPDIYSSKIDYSPTGSTSNSADYIPTNITVEPYVFCDKLRELGVTEVSEPVNGYDPAKSVTEALAKAYLASIDKYGDITEHTVQYVNESAEHHARDILRFTGDTKTKLESAGII